MIVDYLVDIGAGIGQILLQASCTTLCSSFGIEIRRDLIDVGKELSGIFTSKMGGRYGMGLVEMREGDIREPDDVVLHAIRWRFLLPPPQMMGEEMWLFLLTSLFFFACQICDDCVHQ